MDFNYEKVGEREYCERAQLIEYNVSALLERGKFLPLLHSWTTKKFCCSANFAVSPKSKAIAVISSDGELNIMQIKDDKLVLKSQVRVLLDPYPEFRLIEWNSTESLIFSTRSSAVVDVFEANGMFLYKIPMFDGTDGSLQIISQLCTNPLADDENFSDDVYTLQIDGTLSAFRVGKQAYHRLFTVDLGPAPLCSMVYVSRYNLLISCGEFQRMKQSENEMDSSAFGMNVHRILNQYPFVNCLKQSIFKKAWHERIPFLSDRKCIVICAELSPSQQHLLALTSLGDLLLFALPSLRLQQSLIASSTSGDQPIQVGWSSDDSFVVLHSNGQIINARLDEYFDGQFDEYALNQMDNCKRVRIQDSTTYALTEIRLDNIVTPDENKQRVGAELSLFVIFHLTFLLRLLKAFFSFFFGGDATRDLNEKIGIEQSAQLSLYTTKKLSLEEYIEKCMHSRNYKLAISLAEPNKDSYDLDIIYKRQWEDLKQSKAIDEEHLEVLRSVHDKLWVVDECLRLHQLTNLKLHERLLKLAALVVKGMDNERLKERVRNAAQILAIIRRGIAHNEDACELYLRFRNSTVLNFTFAMAEETNFDLLKCLFEAHQAELHNYLLPIMSAVPESTEPLKYSGFLPYKDKSACPTNGFTLSKNDERFVVADSEKIPAKYLDFSEFFLGKEGTDQNDLFVKWCQSRVELIDTVSGLYEDCIQFLDLMIEHGYEELSDLKDNYSLYNNFIVFSDSTNINFKQFVQSDASTIQSTLASHITKSKLLEHLPQVVELIEFADKGKVKATEQILSLVSAHSIRGFELLYSLKQIRPSLLTTDHLIQCFLCSEVVGADLTKAMRELGLPPGLLAVVDSCAQLKSDQAPTFAEIHSAINDSSKATQLVQRFVHANCNQGSNHSDEWWRDLLVKTRQLRLAAFERVVTDDQILRFICQEMLTAVCRNLDPEIPPARQAPFHLVVDLSGTALEANISLLKQSVFEELIVEKSRDFIDSSIPDLTDANLKRASLVLDALRTGARMPRLLGAHKRSIDVIRLSLELGSKRVPATFAYCSKEMLLAEIVNTKSNYKNVKACAELAKLLELSTPSARALSECATCALQREDIRTTRTYVQQLAKSARDFGVVYELAKAILERAIDDDELNDDSLACLIQNCAEDDLNTALGILSEYRAKKGLQKPQMDVDFEASDLSYPDPMYTSIKKLHLYDFDAANKPLKIPVNTHQADIFMSLDSHSDALKRVRANPELANIMEATRFLQLRGTHPAILENLEQKHYRKIALKFGDKKVKDELEDDWNEEFEGSDKIKNESEEEDQSLGKDEDIKSANEEETNDWNDEF